MLDIKPESDKPLDPTVNFQKIQRTEKHVELQHSMQSAQVRLWETLQVKCPGFFHRQTIRNRKGYRENLLKETSKHYFFFMGKTIMSRDIDLNDKSIKKYRSDC